MYSFTDGPSTPIYRIETTNITSPLSVDVITGNGLTIECLSEGNPEPHYAWTLSDGSTRNEQSLTVNSFVTNTNLTCNASNTLEPSVGSHVQKTAVSSLFVRVLCKLS